MPPAEPGALLGDWKQRAAVVQSYCELAGVTGHAQAIDDSLARAQSDIARRDEQRALDRAERE